MTSACVGGTAGVHMRGVCAPAGMTAVAGALNLIHTNNSPNPVSTRVSARLESSEGLSMRQVLDAQNVIAGPIGFLIARRADDAKSTW